MLDLALSGSELHATAGLFLVAPDARESEVRAQLARPAFSRIADLEIAYLPYGELERPKEAISRFGSGLKAIKAISRALPCWPNVYTPEARSADRRDGKGCVRPCRSRWSPDT